MIEVAQFMESGWHTRTRRFTLLVSLVWVGSCATSGPGEPGADGEPVVQATSPYLSAAAGGGMHNQFLRHAARVSNVAGRKDLPRDRQFALLLEVTNQTARRMSADPRAGEWARRSLLAMIERDGPDGKFYAFRAQVGAPLLPVPGPFATGYITGLSQEAIGVLESIELVMSDTLELTSVALGAVASIRSAASNSTTLTADEIELIDAMASIADSSRTYWDNEVYATANGGGEWEGWPVVEEWETAPPQFAPHAAWPAWVGVALWKAAKVGFKDVAGWYVAVGVAALSGSYTVQEIKGIAFVAGGTASVYALFAT